jgi:hypothetical protein
MMTTADIVCGGGDPNGSVANMLGGDDKTYSATDESTMTASAVISLDSLHAVNHLLLQKYIALGRRVREFFAAACPAMASFELYEG